MDLYVNSKLETVTDIFKSLRFTIFQKKRYLEARYKMPKGCRYHAKWALLEGKVYCDFHYDNFIHFTFWGVDYGIKPRDFFNQKIRAVLLAKNLNFEIKEVSYFNRRNKSIFTGFRV